ncbi:MAG: pyridoxal-phosphate dependent enzyme, partial [Candidatus Kariarchaeaceae archaeon]
MYSESDFRKALNRIKDYIENMPLRHSKWLSKELNATVYLKLECFQPGGSFKIRGASNTLLQRDKLPRRVITASGGNHGL